MNFWLLKTEPNTFSIWDLEKLNNQTTCWEGIRNYQARNLMRDQIKINDQVFIYHSVIETVGIFGIGEIVSQAYPDPFQFEAKSKYYDPKAKLEKPIWLAVDVKLKQILPEPITLKKLKTYKENELQNMGLLKKGNRLSIQPVSESEWNFILGLIN